MNTVLTVSNLSVNFKKYSDYEPSLKSFMMGLLKRSRKQPATFSALSNISFSCKDGDRLAIIGRNGAGKSTLLKTISGIYPPTIGHIYAEKRILPLLNLGAGFDPLLTVRENIYFNGAILGLPRKYMRSIEDEILNFSDLKDFANAPLHTVSTGMRARLGFSVASVVKPEILLLDEVFATGDAEFVEKAREKIHEMIKSSNVLLFVSHQEEILRDVCNRAILVDHGKLIMDGSVSAVLDKYHEIIGI